jgi:hypothetical protein
MTAAVVLLDDHRPKPARPVKRVKQKSRLQAIGSPSSCIPNEARPKGGADDPVNDKLAVPVHGRVAGPGKQERSLSEPVQAEQNKERAAHHH